MPLDQGTCQSTDNLEETLLKNYWIFRTVPLLFQFILLTRLTKVWRWTCRWKSRRSCKRFLRTHSWKTSPSKTIWTPLVKKYPGFRGRTATCSWRRLRQLEAGKWSYRSKSQGSVCYPLLRLWTVTSPKDPPPAFYDCFLMHACLCPSKKESADLFWSDLWLQGIIMTLSDACWSISCKHLLVKCSPIFPKIEVDAIPLAVPVIQFCG